MPVARLVSATTAPTIPREVRSRTIPCRAAVLREICLGILCSSWGGNAGNGRPADASAKRCRGMRADASTCEGPVKRCERRRRVLCDVRICFVEVAVLRWRAEACLAESVAGNTLTAGMNASTQLRQTLRIGSDARRIQSIFDSPGRERYEASRRLANNNLPLAARSFGPACATFETHKPYREKREIDFRGSHTRALPLCWLREEFPCQTNGPGRYWLSMSMAP